MATLKDIGEIVGVKPSTVSVVLNNKNTAIKVSDATRDKIFAAASKLNYIANSSAKALVTGRSGNLGFILSDTITGGWGNAYFASGLMGVEDRCKQLGYGLSISRCNLDNIEDFVFPEKVARKNVDGLVLAGDISADVVKKFQDFSVPCVALGSSPEIARMVPTVSVDQISLLIEAASYAYQLGHRKVGLCTSSSQRSLAVVNEAARRMDRHPELSGCQVHIFQLPGQVDWAGGEAIFSQWAALLPNQRPSVIITSDQAAVGLVKAMDKKGCQCPKDISVISNGETDLCSYTRPGLTAMAFDRKSFGKIAVDLLVDHLDKGATLKPQQSIFEPRFKLIQRESVADLT